MVNPRKENTRVKNQYGYHFIHMSYKHIGKRKDSFAERLAFYMNKYNLSAKQFAEISHELAGKNGFRVTKQDIEAYLYRGVSPKIDKLYAISQVMGVTLDYFCGYGTKNRKSSNPIIEARYRKSKRRNPGQKNGKE